MTLHTTHRGRGLLGLLAGSVLLTGLSASGTLAPPPVAAESFASPAFSRVWERTDKPVAQGKAPRSWLWGNEPFASLQEKYAQGVGGTHLVQYFDKSRMEINDPSGDPNSPWYVTNGLLTVEMMTGKVQVGNSEFETLPPSNLPVAGDTTDVAQTAPSYNALGHLNPTDNGERKIGTPIVASVNKNGHTAPNGGPAGLATVATYVPQTDHNIADVFWTFLNSSGMVYENGQFQHGQLMNWVFVMGYPVTEPYWTTIRVNGASRQVLVQAFQRRILTYSPTNAPGWQVEMGNVGRHYYSWRYERPSCSSVPVRGFGTVWSANPETAKALGCPQPWTKEQSVPTTIQHFEHGTMLYVGQTYSYPFGNPSIFVLFDDGTYQHFDSAYVEGQPAVCNPTAPSGLSTPQRGFGKVWCEGTGARVRERLGWATDQEKGGAGAWQQFDCGLMYWTSAGNQIFALLDLNNYNPNQDTPRRWQGFADTFNP